MTSRRFYRTALSPGLLMAALAAIAVGCASAKMTVSDQQAPDLLPRPDRFLVYDVAATIDDLPSDSELRSTSEPTGKEQSPEDIELGKELGAHLRRHDHQP